MKSISTKNYKKYLLNEKGEKEPKQGTSDDAFSEIVAIQPDSIAEVTIRKRQADGNWVKSRSRIESIEETDPMKASDRLASFILTENTQDIAKEYHVHEVALSNYRTYPIEGNGSVKELSVGIFSSETSEESSLHLLLNNVRKQL